MTGESGFQVDAAAIARHAVTVEAVADDVAQARAAAVSVSVGREAYGFLCQLIPALLDPLQESVIDALQSATDSLHESGDELKVIAGNYTEADRRSAGRFGQSPR